METMFKSAQGQDRSEFQAVTNWDGLDFGFAKATESTGWADPDFAANWRNMATLKVRGAYHFFHPAADPIAQAKWFVGQVKRQGLKPGDVLVADIEILSGSYLGQWVKTLTGRRARHQAHAMMPLMLAFVDTQAKTFLDEVARLAGPANPVVVYTDLAVAVYLPSCTGYPLWIAYPSPRAPLSVAPWKAWTFWQWSFGGAANGSDQDAFNGSVADLETWVDHYKSPPPPPWTWRRATIQRLEDAENKLAALVTAAAGAETSEVQTVEVIAVGEDVARALELFREHVK